MMASRFGSRLSHPSLAASPTIGSPAPPPANSAWAPCRMMKCRCAGRPPSRRKWQKLQDYRRKGIVGPEDAYIIAVSGVQLGVIAMDHGISRLPLAAETVFPVGPLAVILNMETHRIEGSRVSERFPDS
jgi:hypothetical protein